MCEMTEKNKQVNQAGIGNGCFNNETIPDTCENKFAFTSLSQSV